MAKKPWTRKDELFIWKHYNNDWSPHKLSKHLGRSQAAIRSRMNVLRVVNGAPCTADNVSIPEGMTPVTPEELDEASVLERINRKLDHIIDLLSKG